MPDDFQHLVIFSDNLLCVNGANKWMANWEVGGWSRRGRPIANVDLWQVLKRARAALSASNINFSLRHVPAHVGIYGNERADRLAKAAADRGHLSAARTEEELADRRLDGMADAIVAACLVRM